MSTDLCTAWDAAMASWQSAYDAMMSAPNELSFDADDHIGDTEFEAWVSLMEAPAPDWNAAAWKVKELLTPQGDVPSTAPWAAEIVTPLLADLDRLIAEANDRNGTAGEFQSPAAPDQHKSEEIIVADTASSIDASAMEATAVSVIVRLAQLREAASQKADAYVAVGGNASMDHGHWHRLWMALTEAIICHVPTSLSDALLVLEGVSSIRDLMENTDCTDQERRDCSEATTIAILNCLPVVSDHASDDARVLSASGVKVALRRIAIREGRHHG